MIAMIGKVMVISNQLLMYVMLGVNETPKRDVEMF